MNIVLEHRQLLEGFYIDQSFQDNLSIYIILDLCKIVNMEDIYR